jgi:2-polyprenyl-3-methyl-5-hydroxy-6-metoxy-1,4-benzoquinol methylase
MSIIPRDAATAELPTVPRVEWEEADCLLCGSPRYAPLLEAPDAGPDGSGLWFAVVQCRDCGLCFTNPRPSRRSIGQFYPAVYGPHRPPHDGRRAGRRRSREERQMLPWHGQGRLLDFGCGGGAYLERMHRQGWDVTGLDVSATAIECVRSRLGLRALLGTLPHPKLGPASFDVITMWHSLEHVHEPLEVLRAAHGLLAPGGKLLVATPNIDSLPFRWFGQAWYGLDLPRHLTHFSPRTLRLMLQRAGFTVSPVRMLRYSDWLRSSARLACRLAPARWPRWLKQKPLARLTTWYSYFTRQTDCILVTAER